MTKDELIPNPTSTTGVARPSSTLVIGLGNPILGDDGVGWRVAEAIRSVTGDRPSVEVDCLSLGGLSLMERMVGCQRVILIDSMETGQDPEGSIRVFPLEKLPNPSAGHSASAHDTSLITALEAGRSMGLPLPDQIFVVAIEARQVYNFSEQLSPAVAAAVPEAVRLSLEFLSPRKESK